MNIMLDYILSPQDNLNGIDLEFADENALRYQYLIGDQILIAQSVDFSARWGWIPLLDFAACLKHIAESLSAGDEEKFFEFTESSDFLCFRRKSTFVTITSNYTTGSATILLPIFLSAADSYSKKLLQELSVANPSLKRNTSICKWYPS